MKPAAFALTLDAAPKAGKACPGHSAKTSKPKEKGLRCRSKK